MSPSNYVFEADAVRQLTASCCVRSPRGSKWHMHMARFAISIILFFYSLVSYAQEDISFVAPAQQDILSEAQSIGFNNIDEYVEAYNYCFPHYFKIVRPREQSGSCAKDALCKIREYEERSDRMHKQMCSSEWTHYKCGGVMQQIITDHKGVEIGTNKKFEVVAASQSCRYFVVAQQSSYLLVEDSLCHCPRRGDIGYGKINSRGFKEVKLNGIHCQLFVEEASLSESRALDSMTNKCKQ